MNTGEMNAIMNTSHEMNQSGQVLMAAAKRLHVNKLETEGRQVSTGAINLTNNAGNVRLNAKVKLEVRQIKPFTN